jgi:hypothetical protein
MTVLIPLGYWLAGFPGAIVGFSMSDLFKYAVSAMAAIRVGVGAWRQDLLLTGGIVVLSALTLGLRSVIHAGKLPAIVDALIVTVVVTGGWAAIWRARSRHRPALA